MSSCRAAWSLFSLGCVASACAGPTYLADVDLRDSTRIRHLAVEEVRDEDGYGLAEPVSEAIADTGIVDEVERVTTTSEVDLTLRASFRHECTGRESPWAYSFLSIPIAALGALPGIASLAEGNTGDGAGIQVLVGSTVSFAVSLVAFIAAIPNVAPVHECDVAATFTLFRGGRPFRAYSEEGHVQLRSFTARNLVDTVTRRAVARIAQEVR